MGVAEPLLKKSLHPTVIVGGYMEALQLVQSILEEIAIPIDTSKKDVMLDLIQATVGTKFVSRWGTMISELALKASRTVMVEQPNGKVEVDIKQLSYLVSALRPCSAVSSYKFRICSIS